MAGEEAAGAAAGAAAQGTHTRAPNTTVVCWFTRASAARRLAAAARASSSATISSRPARRGPSCSPARSPAWPYTSYTPRVSRLLRAVRRGVREAGARQNERSERAALPRA